MLYKVLHFSFSVQVLKLFLVHANCLQCIKELIKNQVKIQIATNLIIEARKVSKICKTIFCSFVIFSSERVIVVDVFRLWRGRNGRGRTSPPRSTWWGWSFRRRRSFGGGYCVFRGQCRGWTLQTFANIRPRGKGWWLVAWLTGKWVLNIILTRQESSMIHSASPQSRPAVIVAWFWSFGTDGQTDVRYTLCGKIVITTGWDCGRPRGSIIDNLQSSIQLL